jgi:GTP-binding protein
LETEKNLALKVEDTGAADQFIVHGRGILHLGILIETMRREGYELQLGMPQVIFKEIEGNQTQRCLSLLIRRVVRQFLLP